MAAEVVRRGQFSRLREERPYSDTANPVLCTSDAAHSLRARASENSLAKLGGGAGLFCRLLAGPEQATADRARDLQHRTQLHLAAQHHCRCI